MTAAFDRGQISEIVVAKNAFSGAVEIVELQVRLSSNTGIIEVGIGAYAAAMAVAYPWIGELLGEIVVAVDERNGRDPKPCTLVECHPDRRYDIEVFERFVAASPDRVQPEAIAKVKLNVTHRKTP